MSLQGIPNQPALTTFIKQADKQAAPAQDKPATGGARERDDVDTQNQANQAHDVDNTAEAQVQTQDKASAAKEKFLGQQGSEVVKTIVQSTRENVDKAMKTKEVQPDKVALQSFESLAQGLEKVKDKKDEKEITKPKEEGKLGSGIKEGGQQVQGGENLILGKKQNMGEEDFAEFSDDQQRDIEADNMQEAVSDAVQDSGSDLASYEIAQEGADETEKREKLSKKNPKEIMDQFKLLVGKIPDSQMSQDDKQKSIAELDGIVNSPGFAGLAGNIQDAILGFIDGVSTQKASFELVETGKGLQKESIELTGPLTGVTLNKMSSVNGAGGINRIDQSSVQAAPILDASFKLVTQSMPDSSPRLVNDMFFGSDVEIDIKPGITPEQFKTSIDATVNKMLMSFTPDMGSGIDRAQLKSTLESAFNAVARHFETMPEGSAMTARVPITQDFSGALQSGKLMVSVEPRMTLT